MKCQYAINESSIIIPQVEGYNGYQQEIILEKSDLRMIISQLFNEELTDGEIPDCEVEKYTDEQFEKMADAKAFVVFLYPKE